MPSIELTAAAFGGALLLGLGVLLRGYLSTKGRNIATQEDVRKITTAVEEVRVEYSQQMERIRSELQSVRDAQAQLRTARHDALFSLVDPCIELLVRRLPQNLGELPADGGVSLYGHQEAIRKLCVQIQTAFFRLEVLLSEEDDLLSSAREIVEVVPDLTKAVNDTYGAVKIALVVENDLFQQGRKKGDSELEAAVAESNKSNRAYRLAIQEPGQRIGGALGRLRALARRDLLRVEAQA